MTPKYWFSCQVYAILCTDGIFPCHVLPENKVLVIGSERNSPILPNPLVQTDHCFWIRTSGLTEHMEINSWRWFIMQILWKMSTGEEREVLHNISKPVTFGMHSAHFCTKSGILVCFWWIFSIVWSQIIYIQLRRNTTYGHPVTTK